MHTKTADRPCTGHLDTRVTRHHHPLPPHVSRPLAYLLLACVFTYGMLGTTLPTPLYVLYLALSRTTSGAVLSWSPRSCWPARVPCSSFSPRTSPCCWPDGSSLAWASGCSPGRQRLAWPSSSQRAASSKRRVWRPLPTWVAWDWGRSLPGYSLSWRPTQRGSCLSSTCSSCWSHSCWWLCCQRR